MPTEIKLAMSYSSISVADDLLRAKELGEDKLNELKQYVEHGSFSLKLSGLVAGLAIMFVSISSILGHIVTLSSFAAIIDVYLFAFGAVACLLECKEYAVSEKYLAILKEEALCLYRPYGRGAFYFFVGVLMAFNGGLFGLVAGGYTAVTGAVIFVTSRDSAKQLHEKLTLSESTASVMKTDNSNL